MNNSYYGASRRIALTVLATVLCSTALRPALAGEHDLWREQVADARSAVTTLVATADAATVSNHRLWREQISSGPQMRYLARGVVSTQTPGFALWREQVGPRQEGARGVARSDDGQPAG